ncbi:hypothetical protein [Elizabethkingia meningoseptica]|uniref:hypothetical protein n=1 Tax=Elizabethkingia meningoseptica TaxID=238 RepID=UPI0038915A3C
MKYFITSFITFFSVCQVFAQSQHIELKNDEITIPLHTEFVLGVKNEGGKLSDFKILKEKQIKETIDLMSVLKNTGKKEKPQTVSNEIEFKFANAEMMTSKFIILTTVQHLKETISFKAKIRIKGSHQYMETSIVHKAPNVFSVEQWQDDIDSIILYDFKIDHQ